MNKFMTNLFSKIDDWKLANGMSDIDPTEDDQEDQDEDESGASGIMQA